MKTPNLRDWEPKEGDAKHVDDTKMLNTTAREASETVTATNDNKEHVVSAPAAGSLGATGRH